MCIDPGTLSDGKTIACRKCWQCIENSIQDWVGRSIAQSKTSSATFSVTLTYGGGDVIPATVLTYPDIQRYFKLLRRHGYKFKYLVAGEHGTAKGRAHWHLLLFFDGKYPKRELRERISCKYWPHGWSFWDEPNIEAIKYVCKYIKKDQYDQGAQAYFMMSKKPPIGVEYFDTLAKSYAENGIAPRDLKYKFKINKNREGKPVEHFMHGAIARDFVRAFLRHWREIHGDLNIPNSELVESWLDKWACYAPDPVLASRQYGRNPEYPPTQTAVIKFDEPANRYRAIDGEDTWSFVPVDPTDLKGEHVWLRKRDGRTVAFLQSLHYLEMCRRSQAAHRQANERRTSPLSADNASEGSRPSQSRKLQPLPMVGDGRLLRAHREAQKAWAALDGKPDRKPPPG